MHAYLRLRVWFSVQVVRVGVAKCERVEYKRKDSKNILQDTYLWTEKEWSTSRQVVRQKRSRKGKIAYLTHILNNLAFLFLSYGGFSSLA
jgi:hypothetical protein